MLKTVTSSFNSPWGGNYSCNFRPFEWEKRQRNNLDGWRVICYFDKEYLIDYSSNCKITIKSSIWRLYQNLPNILKIIVIDQNKCSGQPPYKLVWTTKLDSKNYLNLTYFIWLFRPSSLVARLFVDKPALAWIVTHDQQFVGLWARSAEDLGAIEVWLIDQYLVRQTSLFKI